VEDRVTDKEVLENLAESKMDERRLQVLLKMTDGAIGICDLYVRVNPEFLYDEGPEGFSPIDERELRRILQSLQKSDWVARKRHSYSLSDSVRHLISEAKPALEQAEAERVERERHEQAARDVEREERLREKSAIRKAQNTAIWGMVWKRQGGKCCVCEKEVPPVPSFVQRKRWDGTYEEQRAPFIRHLAEMGDVLPCARCYSRLTRVKTQEQFIQTKKYWNAVDSAQEANPGLIPMRELIKLGMSEKQLRLGAADGSLPTQVFAGELFFDRGNFRLPSHAVKQNLPLPLRRE
jgi:hypothetical protein